MEQGTSEVIRKSFKKCGITNALDWTKDDLFGDSDNDEDPYEGFTTADVEEEACQANVSMTNPPDGECL